MTCYLQWEQILFMIMKAFPATSIESGSSPSWTRVWTVDRRSNVVSANGAASRGPWPPPRGCAWQRRRSTRRTHVFWIHQYLWNHGIHQGSAWKYFVILISLSDPSFFEDVLLNDENAMGIWKVRALGTRHQQASWHSCRGEFLRSHMPKCPCFLWSFFPDVSVS